MHSKTRGRIVGDEFSAGTNCRGRIAGDEFSGSRIFNVFE